MPGSGSEPATLLLASIFLVGALCGGALVGVCIYFVVRQPEGSSPALGGRGRLVRIASLGA